jgi:hypothetical protein
MLSISVPSPADWADIADHANAAAAYPLIFVSTAVPAF